MTPEIENLLHEVDWRDISTRLLRYAAYLSRCTGQDGGSTRLVSDCNTLEDLVSNAIEKFLNGTRTWDPGRCTLLQFLKQAIRGDLGHARTRLANRPAPKRLEADGVRESGRETPLSDAGRQACASITSAFLDSGIRSPASRFRTRLEEDIRGDQDLELVVMCISEGISTPRRMAEELGMDVQKVYDLKRRLQRVADRILQGDPDVLRGGGR